MKIQLDDADFVGLNFDEIGRIIFWNGEVLRAIYPQEEPRVRELFSCGLINALIEARLIPHTEVTDYRVEGFSLVLRHEKIEPIIFPNQWSYSMFKDAAVCLLKVNQIAMQFGYQTIDGHGFNILFRRNQPIFVDLGSFIKVRPGFKGWNGYEEYRRFFYYPLRIFSGGNNYIARSILNQTVAKNWMPHRAYYIYQYKLLRILGPNVLRFVFENFYRFRNISFFSDEEILTRAPKRIGKWLVWLRNRRLLPFQRVSFERQIRVLERMSLRKLRSVWSDYYVTGDVRKGELFISKRFERIVSVLKPHAIESALEFGGNKGLFAQALLRNTSINQVICTDYDEMAVDNMYNNLKTTDDPIMPVLLDFTLLSTSNFGMPHFERFRSDLVVALALTHHLILSQRVSLERIFNVFTKYSNRYVLIEFMPLGLYSARSKYPAPPVPDWYTFEWFKTTFEDFFTLLHVEELEENRILFFGEKKTEEA
jgi:hypothetical protein